MERLRGKQRNEGRKIVVKEKNEEGRGGNVVRERGWKVRRERGWKVGRE